MIPAKPVISARTVVFAVLVSLSSPLSPGRVFVKNHSSHCASATVASPEIAAFPDGIIIWLFSGSYYLVHETRQRLLGRYESQGVEFLCCGELIVLVVDFVWDSGGEGDRCGVPSWSAGLGGARLVWRGLLC